MICSVTPVQDEPEADLSECSVSIRVARCCKYEFCTVDRSSLSMSLEGVCLLKCNYMHILDLVELSVM